jgi:hypothetical protein
MDNLADTYDFHGSQATSIAPSAASFTAVWGIGGPVHQLPDFMPVLSLRELAELAFLLLGQARCGAETLH